MINAIWLMQCDVYYSLCWMQCDESNILNTMWTMQYEKMQWVGCNLINAMCWMHYAEYGAMNSN